MFIKIDNSNINILYDFINLNNSSFFRYYNKRDPLKTIKNHIYTTILVDDCKDIIGYGHIDYDNVNWIGICIVDKYRGMGYGSSILEHLIDYSRLIQLDKLYLTVDNDNKIAIRLYTKYGFNIDNYNHNNYIKMIKNL
jgi:RimJ/RimL family protein N-acetyltransferase